MPIMPGALTDRMVSGYTKPITRYDAAVFHVAVSEALYPSYAPGTVAHFYVRKDGTICQQIDTAYRAGTCYEGNYRVIGIETQGGLTNANGEPWTDAQVLALARLSAWIHTTHGIPLVLMPDSKPTSKGIGHHRLGVDGNFGPYAYPGRVAGGEKWSKAFGKICPGDAKISQIPGIITAARNLIGQGGGIVTPTPTPTPPSSSGGFDMAKLVTVKLTKSTTYNRNVARIQGLLQAAGYYQAYKVDGICGAGTLSAGDQFQVDYRCGTNGKADRFFGAKSWESLLTGKKW